MTVLFLTADLIFSSRVASAARAQGLELQIASSAGGLMEKARAGESKLVLLDLTAPGCDPGQLTPQLRKLDPIPRVVAFGPHVMEAKLAAAQEAGCDQVLSRGQFDKQLAAILAAC